MFKKTIASLSIALLILISLVGCSDTPDNAIISSDSDKLGQSIFIVEGEHFDWLGFQGSTGIYTPYASQSFFLIDAVVYWESTYPSKAELAYRFIPVYANNYLTGAWIIHDADYQFSITQSNYKPPE